jgi:hypothetical protein
MHTISVDDKTQSEKNGFGNEHLDSLSETLADEQNLLHSAFLILPG